MNRTTRGIALAGAGVVVVLGGYTAFKRMYIAPRNAVLAQLAQVHRDIDRREADTDQLVGLNQRLRQVAATTLGSSEEVVSAALRTSLNEIAAHFQLQKPTVETRSPAPVKNPSTLKVSEFTDRAAKNRPDFFAITATLKGVGSLEALLRTLATLELQPWVHRIDSWTITPVDKTRERFEFHVELTSVYLAEKDLRTVPTGGPGWLPIPDDQFLAYQPILERAVFKTPPADSPPPPPPPPAAPPAAPPAPPYGDWKVTAIVQGRDGAELWLRNSKSGQSLALVRGSMVLDATFIDASGEMATVEVGGARYLVGLGQTLGDRRPSRQ